MCDLHERCISGRPWPTAKTDAMVKELLQHFDSFMELSDATSSIQFYRTVAHAHIFTVAQLRDELNTYDVKRNT